MEYAIRKNERFDSLEITFTEKPAPAILDALKAAKFRWNRRGGFWYGFATEEAARAICGGQEVKEAEAKPRKEAKMILGRMSHHDRDRQESMVVLTVIDDVTGVDFDHAYDVIGIE